MEQRGARNRRAEGAAFGGRHVNFLHLKYFLMVAEELNITPVSYTHLTLPTILRV